MYSFPKKERLCSYSRIHELFAKGDAFLIYPFSVRYMLEKDKEGKHRIMIVCPKRYQHLAVNRNLVKRRMREAYRLNSLSLKNALKTKNCNLDFSLSYISKDVLPYEQINNKICEILTVLENKLQ